MDERPHVNHLLRFTVCLPGHRWLKIAYPPSKDDEASGTFLRCALRAGGPRRRVVATRSRRSDLVAPL